MKLLLPTWYDGPAPHLPGAEVVAYDPRIPVPPEHADAQILVAWGQAPHVLPDAARRMGDLRLVQALHAGPDDVLAAGFAPDVVLCSGVGLHDKPVTEHAVGLILALGGGRRRGGGGGPPLGAPPPPPHVWNEALGGPQPLRAPDGTTHSLIGARVTIWGFGSIAANLAPVLTALGAQVRGIARSGGERAGYPVVTEASLPEVLASTDVLVMILPMSAATRNILDARRLAMLPPSAYLVNVGRGTTVDEDALVAALRAGQLAGAAIDVTHTEPLPADSPLWEAPGLIITPHAAGGRPVGAGELIEHNVNALLTGGSYRNLIPR